MFHYIMVRMMNHSAIWPNASQNPPFPEQLQQYAKQPPDEAAAKTNRFHLHIKLQVCWNVCNMKWWNQSRFPSSRNDNDASLK